MTSHRPFPWLHLLFALLFLAAAALQWNDPDPVRWMAIYGTAALACLLSSRPVSRLIAGLVGLTAAGWAILLSFDVHGPIVFSDLLTTAPMRGDSVELLREIGGLAVVTVWMAVLCFSRRATGSARRPPALLLPR